MVLRPVASFGFPAWEYGAVSEYFMRRQIIVQVSDDFLTYCSSSMFQLFGPHSRVIED